MNRHSERSEAKRAEVGEPVELPLASSAGFLDFAALRSG